MKDKLFEIWFALRCGPRNREFQPLLELMGSPYDLYHADEAEIDRLPCSQSLRIRLADKSLDEAHRIKEFCEQNRVGILFWRDSDYPAALTSLQDPPILLYYKGDLPGLARRLCISVVGTRSMSEYGKAMSYKIGYELASANAVVISGMALGNDSVAAAGAILAGGSTVAVLGCGIETVYPREHETLFSRIPAKGALVTEFPPGTPPEGKNFPIRNRLISGLSQATVVTEAGARSGALITARNALLQGRNLYALPGNVGASGSSGTNQLLSDGAAMVLSARDILDDFDLGYRDLLDMPRLTYAERHSDVDEAGLIRLGISTRVEASPKTSEEVESGTRSNRFTRRSSSNREASTSHRESAAAPRKAPAASPKKEYATPPRREPTLSGHSALPEQETRPPVTSTPARGDASDRALKSLTDTQRKIFELLPLDHAVTIDYITREGYTVGEIMAAMTVLEIKGLTVTLPGGLYSRK